MATTFQMNTTADSGNKYQILNTSDCSPFGPPKTQDASISVDDTVMSDVGHPDEGIEVAKKESAAQMDVEMEAPAGQDSEDSMAVDEGKPPRDMKEAPLWKMSVNLINTYKTINQVYYAQKRKRQAKQSTDHKKEKETEMYNDGWDDEHYDLKVKQGFMVSERFVVERILGKGSFGQVVKAYDNEKQVHVALKIIKSKKPFFQQARTEIELLKELREKDPNDQCYCVRMSDHFVFHNHQCLVFELLSYNLYDLLRNTNFKGVSLNLVRKFARQILTSLAFLALPDVRIIHCDMKPENILLRHPKRSAIKVIDFGSSCHTNETLYSYIQSRFYRSPEVIMGLRYGCAIDMWSLGCILIEMHTGEPLFCGQDEFDQLAKIIDLMGIPPASMIARSPKCKKYFYSLNGKTYKLKKSSHSQSSRSRKTLDEIIGVDSGGPGGRRRNEAGHTLSDYLKFKDLVERMLIFDPDERITPLAALNHSFFKMTAEEGTNTGHPPLHVQQQQQQQLKLSATLSQRPRSMDMSTSLRERSHSWGHAPSYNG